MTRVIGLTGGIACGKSTVTKYLMENKKLDVVDCDAISKMVVAPPHSCYKKIVKEFGEGIVLQDGSGLDRRKLGEIVFADKDKMKKLVKIQGPAIYLEITKRIAWAFIVGTPIVVIDAPTLYETKHLLYLCSQTLVIAAPEETMLKRMMKRDNLTKAHAMDRIKAQLPIEEKAKMGNDVIHNTGSIEELHAAVDTVVAKWDDMYRYGPAVFICLPSMILLAAVFIGGVKWRNSF